MVHMNRKNVTHILAILLCAMYFATTMAAAVYYNSYTKIATIPNGNNCNRAQGFTAGSTYLYSAKINNDESKQVIYRTRQDDGTTVLMTNGDTNTTYTTYLGHANDLVTTNIGGDNCLFVATMKFGEESIVKLNYSGKTYYKEGNYNIKYEGRELRIGALEILEKTATDIEFLFFAWPGDNTGVSFYRGRIGVNDNSGVVNVTHAFDINLTDAKVNGSPVDNILEYRHQGIGYKIGTDRLYVPLTYENISIVLVYDNISTATGTIYASDDLSFRITSSAFPTLFEIESIDNANGKLWFNCNRKKMSTDIANDAICYFNDYTP